MQVDETFRVFAKRWWRSKQLDLDEDTINDYERRLGNLERFFSRFRIGEISPQVVDRFRDERHGQAKTIRKAQDRARTEKRRRPLMETVTDKHGRIYERRRRPLSNTSINAMITLLGQILQQAVDYELIDHNPVRVGGRSARFLKRTRPKRTFLEVDEFPRVARRRRRARDRGSPRLPKVWDAGRWSRRLASPDCESAS